MLLKPSDESGRIVVGSGRGNFMLPVIETLASSKTNKLNTSLKFKVWDPAGKHIIS